MRVFLGTLAGQTSPVPAFSPIVGAQIDLPAGDELALGIDPAFEHGILLDSGELSAQGQEVPEHALAYLAPGQRVLELVAGERTVRALLIGGAPFGEKIVMWWNFIGRTHEEVVAFRDRWEADVVAGTDANGPFGHIDGYPGGPLPAPALPNVRLKPRE